MFAISAVSTHSRPKAAGRSSERRRNQKSCFNTQPPEGGWGKTALMVDGADVVSTHSRPKAAGKRRLRGFGRESFQHTAARRRLGILRNTAQKDGVFQHTAARRRLAKPCLTGYRRLLCFNTQPPEGGWFENSFAILLLNCFNTQPPEGGWIHYKGRPSLLAGFNTQPPEGGWLSLRTNFAKSGLFQHTAARRRLESGCPLLNSQISCFNTQPPEGGWLSKSAKTKWRGCFNTQPPEGGWKRQTATRRMKRLFQHTAARRRLGHDRRTNQGF